jgi:hypothetical protein
MSDNLDVLGRRFKPEDNRGPVRNRIQSAKGSARVPNCLDFAGENQYPAFHGYI